MFYKKRITLNLKGKLYFFKRPAIMGILNVTPDSFYDGGKFTKYPAIFNKVKQMLLEGADFIDIGGYSTRPGAKEISIEEERKRVIPVLKRLLKDFPNAIFSVDTFRAQIAEEAINEGAAIINDISGGTFDLNMYDIVAKYNVPYILMHTKGKPDVMQKKAKYENLIQELFYFFSEKINLLQSKGVCDIIIDPGFGFGKTVEHNYIILKNLNLFSDFGLPLLVGISRKSMIYKLLKSTPNNALNGTSVLNTIAILKGADILRVHDVKEAKELIILLEQLEFSF